MTDTPPYPIDETSYPQSTIGGYRLACKALLLHREAYKTMLETERPFRFGLSFLIKLLLPIALAVSLGLFLDYLTLPRLEDIQNQVFSAITQISFLDAYISQAPYLANFLSLLYEILWFVIRMYGNYPSVVHIFVAIIIVLMSGIFDWITYSMIAQWVARWMGAEYKRNAFYGPMALAYAPRLLSIANIIPGLTMPASLVSTWILATSYQAIRTTFKLSWKRSLVVVFLPYVITTILIILAVGIGIILGLVVFRLIYA
jgi:hypothetical protein